MGEWTTILAAVTAAFGAGVATARLDLARVRKERKEADQTADDLRAANGQLCIRLALKDQHALTLNGALVRQTRITEKYREAYRGAAGDPTADLEATGDITVPIEPVTPLSIPTVWEPEDPTGPMEPPK